MKKLLVVLLALAMIFAFAACGDEAAAPAEEQPAATEAPELLEIGVLSFNNFDAEMLNDHFNKNVAGNITMKYSYFDDLATILLSINAGNIDVMAIDNIVTDYILGLYPDQYAIPDQPMDTHNFVYSMAVKEEDTELLEQLNAAIEALTADGTIATLKEEYITNCDPNNMPDPVQIPVIEGADSIRVVVTGDVPPMDYITPAGEPAGFNVALLSAISAKAGINIELVSATASSRSMMLSTGKADVIFWSRGLVDQTTLVPDYSADMPEGMIATKAYIDASFCLLGLAAAAE